MEKALRAPSGPTPSTSPRAWPRHRNFWPRDEIFRQLVVQRSRAYARESQMRETGKAAVFPDAEPPQVAEYSIRKTYGRLLELFETAFTKSNPCSRSRSTTRSLGTRATTRASTRLRRAARSRSSG